MKILISIQGQEAVRAQLARLSGDRARNRAFAMMANKVAAGARAEATRSIIATYAITADEVRNSIFLRRASARGALIAAEIDIFGSATHKGRSMNLIHFLAVAQIKGQAFKLRRAKGKRADIKALSGQLGFIFRRDRGLKALPGAFIGNQGRTVFERVGKSRLPIVAKQAIGVAQMFNYRGIRFKVIEKLYASLETETRRAVDALLAGNA